MLVPVDITRAKIDRKEKEAAAAEQPNVLCHQAAEQRERMPLSDGMVIDQEIQNPVGGCDDDKKSKVATAISSVSGLKRSAATAAVAVTPAPKKRRTFTKGLFDYSFKDHGGWTTEEVFISQHHGTRHHIKTSR